MIDVDYQISSVERRVGSRTLEAGEARTLTIARVYDTSRDDLWEACTDPERIARWFLPISGDLRPGGSFAFEGNASGTISRCEAPHSVDATWENGGQVSWIELRLTPEDDGRTRFALEHIAHVDDALWAEYGPGAVGIGWDGGMLGLALYVQSGGEPVDRAAVEAWQASDEGRRFHTLASDEWARASIAAGTPAAEAESAAARSTAFYTGEPAA
jgi:uncharacterized protein YndB with AHSA1/START domain